MKPSWLLSLGITSILGAAAVLTVVALSWPEDGAGISLPTIGSPEKAAVREYLRLTLDDPVWEEVQWSGVAQERDGRAIMLRYRTKNRFGASELRVDRFIVGPDGTVEPQRHFRHYAYQYDWETGEFIPQPPNPVFQEMSGMAEEYRQEMRTRRIEP